MRLSLRVAGFLLLAAVGITCTDATTGPKSALGGRIQLAPQFSPEAARIYSSLAAFGEEVTEVHIHLTAADGTQRDTVIAFPVGSDSLVIEIPTPPNAINEQFNALIELRNDQHTVLFSGTQVVTARIENGLPQSEPAIQIQYAGPGKGTKTVSLQPLTLTAGASATVPYQATAVDSSGNPVSDLLVRWTTSDPTLATVTQTSNTAANVVGQGRRGVVTISAITPNGIIGTSTLTLVPAASHLAVISGSGQTAAAGAVLTTSFVVEVQATDNLPVAGVTVNFRSVTAGGSVATATVVSDASGRASTTMTLGPTAGPWQFEAAATGLPPVTVSETATAPVPTTIAKVAGDAQNSTVGAAVAVAPSVLVKDALGNPMVGATVTFTVASGGGSTTGGSATTNASGIATVGSWTLGTTPVANTLTATIGALTATFSAAATVGAPARFALVQALPASIVVGGAPVTVTAQLLDALNNPVPQAGVVVTGTPSYTPGPGTGALTATTNAQGIATFVLPKYSGTIGTLTFALSASGLTTLTPAAIPVIAGAAAGLSITTAPAATAQAGVALTTQPIIQLVDVGNNAVSQAGVNVSASIASGGGTLGGSATQATNANGQAVFTNLSIGGTAGPRTLTFGSATLTPVTSTSIVVGQGAAASIALVAGMGQQATAGTAVAVAPSVKVTDAFGNGVPSVVVTFAVVTAGSQVANGGALASSVTVTTNATGVAALAQWVLGGIAQTYTMTAAASVPNGSPVIFTADAVPAAGSALAITTAPASAATSGVALAAQPVIQLKDAFGNSVTTAGVVVTAAITSGTGTLSNATATTQAGGSATFSGLTITGVAGTFVLQFGAPTYSSASSAAIAMSAGALTSIVMTPSPALLTPGATQQFTAVGKDAQNNVVAIVSTWSVVAGGGTISAGGLFTAGTTAGSYANTVKATSGAVSATASVTVSAGALAKIAVTPNPTTLTTGATQQFTAVGKDVNDNIVSITPTWSVVAGGGTITAGGLFTAGTTAGSYANTVQATSGAISGTVSVTVTAGALASITVAPNPTTLATGATQQFTAVGKDANNNVVAITPTWSIVAGGGSISASGLFSAGTTAGTFTNTVQASSGAISGTASVTVTPGALATITVAPNPATLQTGATQQFTAVGKDVNNNVVTITPTWSVVNGGGGISATGFFTAGTLAGAFTNTVQASSGAITGAASVTVTPGALATITVTPNPTTLATGATQQFTAVGKDANNNVVAITPTWSIVASGGSISAAGLFTAGNTAGSFASTIQATSGAISGTASVTVTPGVLASITVTPNPTTLTAGTTQQFTAVGKDVNNNVVAIAPSWSIVASGGSISAGGLFTAGTTAGTFTNTVQATSGAISGTASVTVTPGALATITVTPTPVTLTTGGTQQFTAVGKDANNNVVSITPTWSIVNGGGTINATGFLTATTTRGTYTNTVHATSGAISGSATVVVNPGALSTITITPNPATLIPGATQQFSAVGHDVAGNTIVVTPTWSVVSGGGSVSGTGLFTGGNTAGTYTNTVQATSGAVSATASVTVNPGPLATITVTPNPTTLATGATQQFTAVGKDANNNVVTITPTWSVVNGGGGINATGLFTAGNTGGSFANSVKATSGAISGTASVTVTPGPLASITVSPNPATLTTGATQQFTAVGKDANNNVVAITPTWSVVNGGGGISGTGLFTAGTTANTFANTVQASSGAISGTASVTVTPGALATITVTPNLITLATGATQQFTAVGKDANNNIVAIAPTWSAIASGGSITTGGLFTAGTTAGTFTNTVQASSGAISGTATVTVTPGPLATITVTPNPATLTPGATHQFTALGKDANNNVVAITPTWTVVAGGGAISVGGLFTAGNTAGVYNNTVQASSGAISGTASVTLNPGPLATITVTPNPGAITTAATQQFNAVGRDAQNNLITITPTWSVINGGGVISGSGLFTAGSTAGTFTNTVQATSGAISGTASATVTPGALATITVTPNPATLATGATQQFTAVGKDANNNIVTITPAWTVTNGGGAISAGGLFTAGNTAGTYTNTVQATSGAISGNATVTVNPGPLATITVTPNPVTLVPTETRQFTAVGKDAQNNIVTITPTWSVVSGLGTINSTGLFTAATTTGHSTVQATVGAINGAASLFVTPGDLTTITITPNPATLTPGATQQFTAVATDAFNNVIPLNPPFSVVAGGGTINSSTGVFTAGATAGTYTNTVQASVDVTFGETIHTVTGNASVIINPGPLATITVTPSPASLTSGASQQFTAVGRDANNNVVSFTPTWSIEGGGTISAGGLFTAGNTAGNFPNTVRAASGLISGTASVTVNAGPLATITISPNPATLASGATQQFTAAGRDANNNIVSIAPTWSVINGGGTIGATGLFTAGNSSGTYASTVQATSGAISGAATVTITAGPPTELVVSNSPSITETNGIALSTQPVIQLADAHNNPASAAGVVVTATITTGTGTLANASATTDANGVATFSGLAINGTAGGFVLQFSASGYSSVSTGTITVSAGAAMAIAMVTQPSTSSQAGSAFATQPKVRLVDGNGNHVLQAGVVITVAIGTGSPALNGTTSATTNSYGVATFTDLSIGGLIGARTLIFSSGALATVASTSIDVTAGPATALGLTTAPSSSATNGAPFPQQPVVQIQDAYGNPVAIAGVHITASITSGDGTLSYFHATTYAGGDAHFHGLKIAGTAGTFILCFAAEGYAAVQSGQITLNGGPAVQLQFLTQPQTTVAGAPQTVQVAAVDANGNIDPNANGLASLSISPNTGNPAAVAGDFGSGPNAFSGGVASFPFFYIDSAGTGYTLFANSSLSLTATSTAFDITPSDVVSISVSAPQIVRSPSQTVDDIAFQLLDGQGQPIFGNRHVESFINASVACGGVGSSVFSDALGVLHMSASLNGGDGTCELTVDVPGSSAGTATSRIAITSTNATHVWMAGLPGDQVGFDLAANWIQVSTGTNVAPSAPTDIPYIPRWSSNIGAVASSTRTFHGLIMDGGTLLDLNDHIWTTTGDVVMGSDALVQGGRLIASGHSVVIQGTFDNLATGNAGSCAGPSGDRATLSGVQVNFTLTVVCGADISAASAFNVDALAGSYIKLNNLSVGNGLTFAGDSLVLMDDGIVNIADFATLQGKLVLGANSEFQANGVTTFNGFGTNSTGDIYTGSVIFGGPGSAGYAFTGGTLNVFGNFSQISGGAAAAFVAGEFHTTTITNEGPSTINMANAGQSYFGQLVTNSSTSIVSDLSFPSGTTAALHVANSTFTVPYGRTLTVPGVVSFEGGVMDVEGAATIGSCFASGEFVVGSTTYGNGTINGSAAPTFAACQQFQGGGINPSLVSVIGSNQRPLPTVVKPKHARSTAPHMTRVQKRPVRGGPFAVDPSKSVRRKVTHLKTPALTAPATKRPVKAPSSKTTPKAPASNTPPLKTAPSGATPNAPAPKAPGPVIMPLIP